MQAAVEEQHKVGVEAERMALVCSLSPSIGPLPPVRLQGRPAWASGAWAGTDGYGGHRAAVRARLEASFADEAEIIFTTASSSGRRSGVVSSMSKATLSARANPAFCPWNVLGFHGPLATLGVCHEHC